MEMSDEKKKMLNGELFHGYEPQLLKEFKYAKTLCYKFNNTRPSRFIKRVKILKKLFKSIKGFIIIEPPFYCDLGYNIEIGDCFYANTGCVLLDCGKITIGDHVMLGPNVHIYASTHPADPDLRKQFYNWSKPVSIGNNVWIGGGSIICPGVKVGDNTVIGAGSIVTKDISPNVLAVGNPCKVKKEFDSKILK